MKEKKQSVFKEMEWKWYTLVLSFLLLTLSINAQDIPHYPDAEFPPYYHQRASQFELLPHVDNSIIFLGNSITDGGNWAELFQDSKILNRGISGDVTKGVLNRLQNVVDRKPQKVFLLIGTNDLARGENKDDVLDRIFQIVALIQSHSPQTRVYVQSIFPVNAKPKRFLGHAKNGAEIKYINAQLQEKAEEKNYTFIDVFNVLANEDGEMNLRYSNDGLHLLGDGYMLWKHLIYPYVYDLQEKPSIIPQPRELEWNSNQFPLYQNPLIVVKNDELRQESKILKQGLEKNGVIVELAEKETPDRPIIELALGQVDAPILKEEAYTLHVTDQKITIKANTAHGVFNAIQTLLQLNRDNTFIDGVSIKDWPAFPYRGYMIDVGRNYQSMAQIKEQIEVMARYKLNHFHFHPTEDVAWRLQIQQYPELTKGEFMTRNKGQYYTIKEVKELQQFAADRHIEFVLEIDMPGHSAAFKRAMGVDMQSEEGLAIVKNILKEIDTTYHPKYLHIGADEVQINNKEFVPEVVDLLHDRGIETIGWAPGGNYDDRTIRQLWTSDAIDRASEKRYIDSRALYLNHMDPLSGVFSVFNRKIGGVEEADKNVLGGEIAVWNDNRVKSEEDNLQMNLAYPGILAFGERAWNGGGEGGALTDIGKPDSDRRERFTDFENRLLDHKTTYFKDKSFPYTRQSDVDWKLFGPFDNKGDLKTEFWPEKRKNAVKDSLPTTEAHGATVWLKHFFSPIVMGTLDEPKENTTWYAYREIYSSVEGEADFWIGFDNPSRSYVVSTPEKRTWDARESRVWVNGDEVAPPEWTYPGREGTTEDPLIDESYEYRDATRIHLKKGWNQILIKAPVGTFQGRSWQHPVKWMFTMVQVGQTK